MVTAPIATTINKTSPADMAVAETGTTLTATLSGDAGLACSLTFKDNGNDTATLSPADTQMCNVIASTAVGPTAVTATFDQGGSATLASPKLSADNLPVKIVDGPGVMLGIMGTGTLSADCTH
jgi:hypothetical protein